MSKKVSAQVASTQAPVKAASTNVLAKKDEEEEARQAQLAEAAGEESQAVEEQVAEAESGETVEAARTIATVAEEIDASAETLAGVVADAPMMFAQAGAAAAGGGAAAGGISTAAIVAGVAVVGVAAAAGGDSDSTPTPTPTPSPAPAPAPETVGQTFTLTTGADVSGVLIGSAGTTGTDNADTFVATGTTYTAGDIINGGGGNDVLNIALTAANGANASSVTNVEAVNFNVTSFADVSVDASNIVGPSTTTITYNALQTGGTTGGVILNTTAGVTAKAGSGITGTFGVTSTGGAVTVDGGSAATVSVGGSSAATISALSATAVNIEGTSATTDTLDLTVNGSVALNTNSGQGGGTDQVENLTLRSGTTAATITINSGDAPEAIVLTGSSSITVVVDAADISTETVTDSTTAGTTTLRIATATAATHNLSNVTVDVIDLSVNTNGGYTFTTKNSANVLLTASMTANGNLTIDSTELTSGSETLNLTVRVSQATNDVIVSDFETINLTVDDNAATTGTITIADLVAGATSVINLTGADNLTLTAGGSIAFGHLKGSESFTGVLTHTLLAHSVTGGSGNDVLTITDANFTVDGGAGQDSLNIASGNIDLSNNTISISNIEVVNIDTGAGASNDTLTLTSTQATGRTLVVTGTDNGGANDVLAIVMSGSSLDLSGYTIDADDVSVTVDLTASAAVQNSLVLTNAGDTISNAGAGAISVNGGAGADTLATGSGADTIIGGEGQDTITSGAGIDTIILTETTAVADTLVFSHSGALNRDVVTGFDVGTVDDLISMAAGNIVDNGGGNDTLVIMAGTDLGATAAGALAAETVVVNTNLTSADATNLLFFSNTSATSFATAIGTAVVTATTAHALSATEGVLAAWYDSSSSQAVYGYIENADADTGLSSADTFHEIVRVSMSTASFTMANIDASLLVA